MSTIVRQYRKMLERAEQTKERLQRSDKANADHLIKRQNDLIAHLKKRIEQVR